MTDGVEILGKPRPAHYINNSEFHAEMLEFYEKNKDLPKEIRPQIPTPIAKKIMMICENLSRSRNFMSSPHREEMVGAAIENCILRIRNFDPIQFKNPFSYFTQIAFFSFLRTIQEEKKEYLGKIAWAKDKVMWDMLDQARERGSDPENLEYMAHIQRILNFEEIKQDPSAPKRTTLAHQKRMKEKAQQAEEETVEPDLDIPLNGMAAFLVEVN